MKHLLLIIIIPILSCTSNTAITEEDQKEFESIAQSFQKKYMGGSENCQDIINSISEDVIMSEIQFSEPAINLTHEQLVQFCPHLPKKQVIATETEQRLISPTIGYDYVSQLYLRKSLDDTVRETASRIWKFENNEWKIIQMNSSLNKACD